MSSRRTLPALFFIGLFPAALLIQSCKNKTSLFEHVSSSQTNITFSNQLEKKKMLNILYYLYYYNGAGVATGDVNNDGLQDIYFAANSKAGNKLYINKGNFEFEDITAKANVAGTADWCTGVTMADVNNDGYLDIYVSTVSNKYGLKGHHELFINNGPGTSSNNKDWSEVSFTEQSSAYGLDASCFTTQTVFFDYDRDGDLDCYMLNQSHHPHANIIDTSNRNKYDSLSGDRLYRNDLKTIGKFTDVSKQAGIYQSNLGYGLGIAIADMNHDGWDDIYVGNDFHENDYYYVNKGNGTFTESGAKHFGHYSRFSMGNDIADYNNDGEPDIITVDMLPPDEKTLKTYGSDENPDTYQLKLKSKGYQNQYSKNCLQRNNGNGISFSEIGLQSGVSATDWSWCPLFADFDNDGNKDLLITSGIVKRPVDMDFIAFVSKQQMKGIDMTDQYDDETIAAMPGGESYPFLFKGDGAINFADVSEEWGTKQLKSCSNGAAYADLDNDGNLDIVINCLNSPALVLKNNAPKKNYIDILLKGDSSNRFAIGSKAYVFAGGKMQYQQLMPARGFMSSSSVQLHFGLDAVAAVDSIVVVWPHQKFQVIRNPAVNQIVTMTQADAKENFVYSDFFQQKPQPLQDISAQVNCNWTHRENNFTDQNVQYLIPHALSTRGPKLAVADVNNDGLDDFYVCGAKFQPGVLMIQQTNGTFAKSDTAFFGRFDIAEETDAVFFDANGDTFQDLMIVSGGNEKLDNPLALVEKLFLNDGKGKFRLTDQPISTVYENKSCIAVADVDKDGDTDVFVGTLADPLKYGVATTSYLYSNDGKANFTKAESSIIQLVSLGIVTAASFIDIDNDGWKDLAVSGEWMPVKIFKNNKGKFTPVDIPGSTGLWQSIHVADVNGDGFTDILAGNWGLNNKFSAGKTGPLKLYAKDFDNNGTTEQIISYNIAGKEYPFFAKDELERALPVLKKAYVTYSEVAGQTVQYMFYDLFKDYLELKAEVLASSCFMNDGKGNFTRVNLPDELQMAPIFSLAPVAVGATNGYMAAGNFYGVTPYEGRYDALQPSFFSFNAKKKTLQYESLQASFAGEVRDIKWVNRANGEKMMIVARNNQPLTFFKLAM
jgi:enediyne biosynthesis protein E4